MNGKPGSQVRRGSRRRDDPGSRAPPPPPKETIADGEEAHPRRALGVRVLGRRADRSAGDVRQGRLRGHLRDPDRQAPGGPAAQLRPGVHRPAARPLGHLHRDGREGQGGRGLGPPRRPARPLLLAARPPLPQPLGLPAGVGGLPHQAAARAGPDRRALRRAADRRRQRPDRRPRQQLAGARPDPGLLPPRPADRRRVLRRGQPGLRPRAGRPDQHPAQQARHRPLHRVRLQGRHRLRRHRLPGRPAAVPAGVHPARRHRAARRLPRQLRPRDLGDRRLPVHHRALHPDSYLTGQKVVEVLEQGLRQWGFQPDLYQV